MNPSLRFTMFILLAFQGRSSWFHWSRLPLHLFTFQLWARFQLCSLGSRDIYVSLGDGRQPHRQDPCRAPSQTPAPVSIMALFCWDSNITIFGGKKVLSYYLIHLGALLIFFNTFFPFSVVANNFHSSWVYTTTSIWWRSPCGECSTWLMKILVLKCVSDLFLHLLLLCEASSLCFQSSPRSLEHDGSSPSSESSVVSLCSCSLRSPAGWTVFPWSLVCWALLDCVPDIPDIIPWDSWSSWTRAERWSLLCHFIRNPDQVQASGSSIFLWAQVPRGQKGSPHTLRSPAGGPVTTVLSILLLSLVLGWEVRTGGRKHQILSDPTVPFPLLGPENLSCFRTPSSWCCTSRSHACSACRPGDPAGPTSSTHRCFVRTSNPGPIHRAISCLFSAPKVAAPGLLSGLSWIPWDTWGAECWLHLPRHPARQVQI